MKTHNIKLNTEFCDDTFSGNKNFEIRENDRGYQKGDHIKFKPYNPSTGLYDNYHPIVEKEYEITYVLNGWGLKNGYIVFGIKEVQKNKTHS